MLAGCAGSREEPATADLSRLDACLGELVSGRSDRCEYQRHVSNGETMYAVFIRSRDMAALRDAGFLLDSHNGEVATARLTIAQLRRISSVPGVVVVENPETAEASVR